MGSFEARKSSASKLSMPPGRSRTTLKLTVLEDEFWVATVGRVSDIDRLEQSSGTVSRLKALRLLGLESSYRPCRMPGNRSISLDRTIVPGPRHCASAA
jgi:hypothetical protein